MENNLSIVVTDSGLGGLSVMAELEKNLRENPIAENIQLTFFNAVADKKFGYNMMSNDKERAALFDSVLEGMVKWYKPDIIMIACNTLSILYPKTKFAVNSDLQVYGIVDFGVDLVRQNLSPNDNSIAIMLGTPMTIKSGAHKIKLTENGIEPRRIIEQPCNLLESEIQDDPFSQQTRDMIKKYIAEAKEKIDVEFNEVCAAFCCTHYGYSHQLFEEELQSIFSCPVQVLNPNSPMSNYLTENKKSNIRHSIINTEIATQVPILQVEIDVLGRLLKKTSEKVYESLVNYNQRSDFFNLSSQ